MNDGEHNSLENNCQYEDYLSNSFDNIKETLKIENEINENRTNNLLNFYLFNEKLLSLIKRQYESISFESFTKYYPINSKWIENFLKFTKIIRLIKMESKGEIKFKMD